MIPRVRRLRTPLVDKKAADGRIGRGGYLDACLYTALDRAKIKHAADS
eukprot:CAMPEP_0180683018 /NCGR_PEP_ID=MMETSP1037_2-20121125/70904_1 /TAXON_ID=632150 /ORGANISM="Azadinium spinosum, Strain 3D9" /LENGTH=47 /DNA_ID= /DNA_START= /DNA_END= /DNA_ORIENTATION=